MKFFSVLLILIIVSYISHINAFNLFKSKAQSKGIANFAASRGESSSNVTSLEEFQEFKKKLVERHEKRVAIIKTVARAAKKLFDVLKFDLSKLNLGNLTQLFQFYDAFATQFKKSYTDENERKNHLEYFKGTLEKIKEHNKSMKQKFIMGVNELSDLNYTEILRQKTGFIPLPERDAEGDVLLQASAPVPPVENMPEEWDWRQHNIMTVARNQGKCGSCWSFAAACVLESHNMKRLIAEGKFDKDKQITVSEQNLIDCSAEKFGSIGCDGGMPQQAWRYVTANGGVQTVESYPYKGKKEDCVYNPEFKADVVVSDARRLKTGEDIDLATAIYNYGPIAIAVHVTKDMAAYKSGIFDDPNCNPKKVNHAVVAVGYAKDYFIVRNSWGPKWGEEGYIKISRNRVNNCGVSQQGYYPIIPNAVDTEKMRDKFT